MLKTNTDLGAEIKALRKVEGWSQDELARRSGVSRGTITLIENAQREPSWGVLRKLDEALGGLQLSQSDRPVELRKIGVIRMGLEALDLGMLLSDEGKLLVNVEGGHKVLTQEMLAALAAG